MYQHLRYHCGTLYYAAVRCNITTENSNSACRTVWIVDRTDHFRISVLTAGNVLPNSLAGGCDQICMKQTLFVQLVHNGINTAGFIQLLHICMTGRCQMTQVWSLCADGICHIKVQLNACFMCDCRQVKHSIGRAAQSHIYSQSILKCFRCQDISWTDIFLIELHNLHTCMLCKLDTVRIYSRNRTIALKSHTDCLCQAVHTVGCVHAGAGTTGWTCMAYIIIHLFLCHSSCSVRAYCLKHRGKTCSLTIDVSG